MKNNQFFGKQLPDFGFSSRSSKIRQFVALLQTSPGEWCLYRTTDKQWNGHSVYRSLHPGTDWAVRKLQENPLQYGVFARWVGKKGEYK